MNPELKWDWPKQTLLSEDLQIGDCWRCCIAAVLQVPAEKVPHFLRDGRSIIADTQRWLNQRGYVIIQSNNGGHNSGFWFPSWGVDAVPQHPVIECGPTVRSKKKGAHHAVVTVRGQLVYDPHPWNCGILWTTDAYVIAPLFAPLPFVETVETGKACDTDRGACACGKFHIKASTHEKID